MSEVSGAVFGLWLGGVIVGIIGLTGEVEYAQNEGERRRALRMAWLTPFWPLILLVMGVRALPRLVRAIVASLREAFGPTEAKPKTVKAGWEHDLMAREMVKTYREYHFNHLPPEPDTRPVQPTPGRWEQP